MLAGTIKKLTMAITERPEIPESYDLQVLGLRRKTTTINGTRTHELVYEYYCTPPKIHQIS